MTLIQNSITALIVYLKAQSDISSLLSTRVFGSVLPNSQAALMPMKAILIQRAGSLRMNNYLDVSKSRLDFICYGETEFEADKTHRTLTSILRDLERGVSSSTFLYSTSHSAGPFPNVDEKTNWPSLRDTWLLEYQETIVT